MTKSYDSINHTVAVCAPLSPLGLAQRAVREIQRRLANPEMRDDCRALARGELRHWRKQILRLRVKGDNL